MSLSVNTAEIKSERERPLGQRKAPPTNKLPSMTLTLMSSTFEKYMYDVHMSNHSKHE